jgi:transposase
MAGNKWQISDELWEKMARLILERKIHPHCVRIASALIIVRHECHFLYVQKDCQWNALNATGICSSNSAHRRFQEWRDAGVFERFWQNGLLACEHLDAIDWSWLSLDGCMTKSPLAGSKKQAATPQTAVNRE